MIKRISGLLAMVFSVSVFGAELGDAVKKDYDEHLAALFDHFHRSPELSTVEHETARRMALELSLAGYDVTEGVGGTGVVAIMENGDGPLVMMRADMDGLPVEEKSGLENASRATQKDPHHRQYRIYDARLRSRTCISPVWWVRRGTWRRTKTNGAAR